MKTLLLFPPQGDPFQPYSSLPALAGYLRHNAREVELRELDVASAQADLDEAQERLEMATITAPFEGVVASVNVNEGQSVNANTVVIQLVDPSVVEMSAVVDEIDIIFFSQGI